MASYFVLGMILGSIVVLIRRYLGIRYETRKLREIHQEFRPSIGIRLTNKQKIDLCERLIGVSNVATYSRETNRQLYRELMDLLRA